MKNILDRNDRTRANANRLRREKKLTNHGPGAAANNQQGALDKNTAETQSETQIQIASFPCLFEVRQPQSAEFLPVKGYNQTLNR